MDAISSATSRPARPVGYFRQRRLTQALLIALCLLYVAVRAYHLSYFGLWHDEVFTVNVCTLPWAQMLRAVVADVVHPPLFYVVMKVWIEIGGSSVLWMRFLPFLFSVLMLIPLLNLCRELQFPRFAVLLVVALVTFNEPLIHYAQELRMYSLLVLLSVCSLWLFVRFLHTGQQWKALTAVNILLVYDHYYGLLFVATEAVVIITWAISRDKATGWPRTLQFSKSLGLTTAAFLPWAFIAVRSEIANHGLHSNLNWIAVPSFKDLVWFYAQLNGFLPLRHAVVPAIILFLVPVALALTRRGPGREQTVGLAIFAFLPTGVAFVASRVLSFSVFDDRYLIICAVPYLLLIVFSLFSTSSARARTAVAAAILAWSAYAGTVYVRSPDRKVAWDVLAHGIARNARVYTNETHTELPLKFYGVDCIRLRSRKEMLNIPDEDFYFVYRDTTWQGPQPEAVFPGIGFKVVETFAVHDSHEKITAVRLQAAAPRRQPRG